MPRCVVGAELSTRGHMEGYAGSMKFVREPMDSPTAMGGASKNTSSGTTKNMPSHSLDLPCVHANKVLPELLGSDSPRIDLLNIDIEGMEPEVLRCFPWRDIRVGAVLIETTFARDLRDVDRFFHRNGFVSEETFSSGHLVDGLNSSNWLDHLYVARARKAVYPPWRNVRRQPSGTLMGKRSVGHVHRWVVPDECPDEEFKHRKQWCVPWLQWEPASDEWGPCQK